MRETIQRIGYDDSNKGEYKVNMFRVSSHKVCLGEWCYVILIRFIESSCYPAVYYCSLN